MGFQIFVPLSKADLWFIHTETAFYKKHDNWYKSQVSQSVRSRKYTHDQYV